MSRILKIFVTITIFACNYVYAAIEGGLSVTTGFQYNNNIIQLSKKYMDEFRGNEKPQRYSVSSLDDIVLDALITAGTGITYAGGWKSGITLSCSGDFYTNNSICNEYSLKGTFYQRIPDIFWVYLRYRYSPYLYVADYYIDSKGYEQMTYGEDEISLSIRRKFFRKITFGINSEYSRAYYNKYFTRFDNDQKAIGSSIGLSINPFDVDLDYELSKSDKIDRGSKTYKDSITDASYNAHKISLSTETSLPKIKKFSHSILFSYSFEYRKYTSVLSGDEYHNGRTDLNNNFKFSYCTKVFKRINTEIYYQLKSRKTDSEKFSELDNEKSYSQMFAGLKLSTELKSK